MKIHAAWLVGLALSLSATAAEQNLWLRPLTDFKVGEVNQILVDEHVMRHAVAGQVRVVDAELQPLAGQFATLLPPEQQLSLAALPLHRPADRTEGIPLALTVEQQQLLLKLGRADDKQQLRWLIRLPADTRGELKRLSLTWRTGTEDLTRLVATSSSDLSSWSEAGRATLPPSARLDAPQELVLQGTVREYLLLSLEADALPQPQLAEVKVTFRPLLQRRRIWSNIDDIETAAGQWSLVVPPTAPTSLRFETDSALFATTLALRDAESEHILSRWNIYRTAGKTLAEEPLRLQPGSRLQLQASTALPPGAWQWGWEPQPYLFLAVADGPYFLAYGTSWPEAATSLDSVMPALGAAVPLARLGEPQQRRLNAPFAWQRLALIGGFVAAAGLLIALGYSQWRSLRREAA